MESQETNGPVNMQEMLVVVEQRRAAREKERSVPKPPMELKEGDEIRVKKTEGRVGMEPRWQGPFPVVEVREDRVIYKGWKGVERHAHRDKITRYNHRDDVPEEDTFSAEDVEMIVNGGNNTQ